MAMETLDTGTPTIATPASPARSRRALLAAALGGLGGLFASRLGTPDRASAAAGDPLIIGNTSNNAGTANTRLTTASTGTALLVTQNGSGTALRGSAVGGGSIAGFFTAANGTGVSGVTGNPNSYGVFGSNDDAAAGSGGAVRAAGNANNGLVASTNNAAKVAIKATNSAVDGTVALFENTSGGVEYTAGPAIRAYTGGGTDQDVHPGGEFFAAAGEFAGPHGVIAASNGTGYGVFGQSSLGTGVRGSSGSGTGVSGVAGSGTGVRGSTQSGHAVYGNSLGTGFAGYFNGKAAFTQFLDVSEFEVPPNPAANVARLFVRDNGGKTELCVIFATGAVQVIKTQV